MRKLLCVLLILFSIQIASAPTLPGHILRYHMEMAKLQAKMREFYTSDFSSELFYEALVFVEVQNPEIVFKQSILETGWFTSSSFKDYNNPFGMKEPKCRETLCDSTALGHGSFGHWFDAVKDYKMWQDYWIDTIYNTEQYYHFLDTLPYAEAKHYTQTLQQMKLDDLLDLPIS